MSPAAGLRWRTAVLGAVLLAALVLPATAAQAHTRTQETTNVASRITADPGLPGVHWEVYTGGLLLGVANDSDRVLIVEGYDGEPYLRIGPDGVEHNRRSPATYLNDERAEQRVGTRTGVAMPRDVDPSAPPEWVQISTEPRAIWHDHRIDWPQAEPPPFVEAGPIARMMMRTNLVGPIGRAGPDAGAFREWTVPVRFGGEPAVLAGELVWDDPPSAVPYLVVAALLVALGLLGLRRRDPAAVLRPAALMVLAVASVNGIHFVDDLISWPSALLDELFGLVHTALFLGTAVAGALWALRVDHGRVLALSVASGALLYHQGFVHLPILQASHFPTVWPEALVRVTVAAGLVQALVVAIVLLRLRSLERAETPSEATGPTVPTASAQAAQTTQARP